MQRVDGTGWAGPGGASASSSSSSGVAVGGLAAGCGTARTMVRVISMPAATQRRAQFVAAAVDAGIPWDFFDGLTEPRPPLVYAPESALVRAGRVLRAGELGCYASHYAVWQAFLGSAADQLIVFEDDVMVDWAAVRRIAAQDLGSIGVQVLKLYATFPIQYHAVRHKFYSDHSHLVRVRGYCYGTQAYVLTRCAARALVDCCAVLDMPIDWAMSRYWAYGHANYAVLPYPVIERLVSSSIGHPPAAARARGPRLAAGRRLLWRLRDRSRRFLVDWKLRLAQPALPGISAGPADTGPQADGPDHCRREQA